MGNDCALFSLCSSASTATCALNISGKESVRRALMGAMNNLAAGGQMPRYVVLNITLPERAREKKLQDIMEEATAICKEQGLCIIGGHTEVSAHVTAAVISATALGEEPKEHMLCAQKADGKKEDIVGYDVVVSGYIAADAASLIAVSMEEELLLRFPQWLVTQAKDFREELSVMLAAKTAYKNGTHIMHDIREGGIFGALWEMAQREEVGLTVSLESIPMKQSVVEICNFYDINPYEALSQGCLLMAAKDGDLLVQELCSQGVVAAVIGKVTDSNDRIIHSGEEVRYMDLPKPDQIRKLL